MHGPLKGILWSLKADYGYILGNYEPTSILNFLQRKTKDSPFFVCYDCGANVGHFSFLVSNLLTKGVVYAFEPIESNITQLNTHLLLNKKRSDITQKIEVHPFGLSDSNKKLHFTNLPNSEGNTYISTSPKMEKSTIAIQAYSIDYLVFNQKMLPPNLIKIDIEGAEFDLLKGAERVIERYKPAIILATHDFHLPGVKNLCLNFLSEKGYTYKSTAELKIVSGLEDFIAEYLS